MQVTTSLWPAGPVAIPIPGVSEYITYCIHIRGPLSLDPYRSEKSEIVRGGGGERWRSVKSHGRVTEIGGGSEKNVEVRTKWKGFCATRGTREKDEFVASQVLAPRRVEQRGSGQGKLNFLYWKQGKGQRNRKWKSSVNLVCVRVPTAYGAVITFDFIWR